MADLSAFTIAILVSMSLSSLLDFFFGGIPPTDYAGSLLSGKPGLDECSSVDAYATLSYQSLKAGRCSCWGFDDAVNDQQAAVLCCLRTRSESQAAFAARSGKCR